MFKISSQSRSLVRQALREDIGTGDITTDALVPSAFVGEARIEAKASGILCGGPVVLEVFRLVDPRLKIERKVSDGARVSKGKSAFVIRGRVASILKGERVALNFLSHLSGIATLTNQFVSKTKGTRAEIYDTRKTTPLWRELEKYAVRCGGGQNHRLGLWDEVLVKDNHWYAIGMQPSLRGGQKGQRSNLGVQRLLQSLRSFAMTNRRKIPVEVEAADLKELSHLLEADFHMDRILLDNFSVPQLRQAVHLVRRSHNRILLEASGGVTLANVCQIAKAGVDRISVGALTHSAPALDFSLNLGRVGKK